MIRILLADDHLLFRQAIRDVIAREQDLAVVAETGNGQEAGLLAAEMQPDVVLMDLTMPACNGFETIKYILACAPQTRVVIFSASHQEEYVLLALQCGAIGYITKDVGAEGLLTALRRAAHNELYMTSALVTRFLALVRTLTLNATQTEQSLQMLDQSNPLIHPSKQSKSKRTIPLSRREQEVLALIRRGQRDREIAAQLRISEATVHKHVQHIFEKLNAHNRAEALFRAQS